MATAFATITSARRVPADKTTISRIQRAGLQPDQHDDERLSREIKEGRRPDSKSFNRWSAQGSNDGVTECVRAHKQANIRQADSKGVGVTRQISSRYLVEHIKTHARY